LSHLSLSQRLARLKVRTAEIAHWRVREKVDIADWSFNGAPMALGDAWPRRDGVARLAATAVAPSDWPLAETRLAIDVGGESLLLLTYDSGETACFGLDPNHQEFPLKSAKVSIAAESVARLPFGEPVRAPRLNRAALIWLDPPVDRLRLLLAQIAETIECLSEHDVAPHLLDAAERALRALDWPSETQNYIARVAPSATQQNIWTLPDLADEPAGLNDVERRSVIEAFKSLSAALKTLQAKFPPQGELALTGHAHIDLAWLWPYEETRRKLRRTFHTALSLIGTFEDFRFNQSTAQYYTQIEEDDPALLSRIVAAAESGAWESVGGMWVEPDTMMPSGESLARQLLYGQKYFEKTFGARHAVCWLPDTFGFSAALPQLLKQAGIDSFFTIKVNWSETNRMPSDFFWWEGLDGSRVLAHTFDNPGDGYNGFLRPRTLAMTWRNFRGKVFHPTSLLAVGYGDGGGGVTPEMIERERQLRDFPTLPRARWTRVEDFFAGALESAEANKIPVWVGEMYLELHRGTLTTQAEIKRLHRAAEHALVAAETVASLAHLMGGSAPQNLEDLWRVLLKNEFHDILAGSSIREACQDAEAELGEALAGAHAVQRSSLEGIATLLPRGETNEALIVVNPSLSPRALRIALPDGRKIAADGEAPPLSVSVFDASKLTPRAGLTATARRLENEFLTVSIGEDGTIDSLVHKRTGREALAGGGNQIWAYPADKPRQFDAWDIEEDYAERGEELKEVDKIELLESGPVCGRIRVTRRYRASTIAQTYVLVANSRRLDIETEIDWRDRRTLLRTLTPAAVRSMTATFECAFGVVKRPTHANTSWDMAMFEAAAHRFVDLSEPGFGLALLNDAKYGHSVRGNVIGMSLLRSPVYPDPLADEGRHRFTYALMPHAGDWYDGGVREEADDLNQPLLSMIGKGLAVGTFAPLAISGVDVGLAALKAAEDGDGLIVRVYEPAGRRGELAVAPPPGWKLTGSVNLLEEPDGRGEGFDVKPFELRSWRLKRA
jgi:alpha-mannosidase